MRVFPGVTAGIILSRTKEIILMLADYVAYGAVFAMLAAAILMARSMRS